MNRTPFRRTAPMPRSTTPLRQKRPAKPGERDAEQSACILLWGRACQPYGHPLCEIWLPGVCAEKAVDPHHRLKQSQGGPWEVSNLLAVCRPCHLAISDTRDEYYDNGWLVRSFGTGRNRRRWAKVPVLRRGVLVLLDDLGSFQVMGDAA